MKHYKIKFKNKNYTESKIFTELELKEWLRTHAILGYLADNIQISFSVSKKNPLPSYTK